MSVFLLFSKHGVRRAEKLTNENALEFASTVQGLFFVCENRLLLPEARVLLQTGIHDFLVLLAVDAAGGVHQALQTGEPETEVQAPQLEGRQRGQTSLVLLLVSRAVVSETHHTWTPHTD